MCGFTGILNFEGNATDEKVLRRMGDVIRHRGPDDDGSYMDTYIGLAFKRLSIIDLQTGHQPMHKGDSVIVYNGEIYNYRELRKELKDLGHVFTTKSDTEVLLTAYLEWGRDALNKLNGMWAFAVWNKTKKRLFFSRDRFGIKPLYYANDGKRLIFASEIKSVIEGGVKVDINKDDIAEYLHFGFLAGERTLFRDIYAVLPGSWLEYSSDVMERGFFFDIENEIIVDDIKHTEDKVMKLLENSVNDRMISDVPLGTLLSGGLDSSVLTYISNNSSKGKFHTFSVKMEEARMDESRYAKDAADYIGTTNHTTIVSKEEFTSLLPYIAWLHDEPVNFHNALYMYSVCNLANNFSVKVLLSGEGADELFGGYVRYLWTMENVLKRENDFSDDQIMILGSATYGYDKVMRLIGRVEWNNPWRHKCYEKFKHLPVPDCLMRMDQCTRLVSLLYRQDRMGMGAGIEVRVPFLDYRLVEFVNKIHSNYKMNKKKSKIILKDIASKIGFSHDAINRPKMGFPTPVEGWIKKKNFLPYLDFISDGKSSASELYDNEYAAQLIDEFYKGRGNHGRLIWMLVSLELWSRIFIDKTLKAIHPSKSVAA